MFKDLKNSPRVLLEAELKPVQSDRFQPTGFPDLGAAVYECPDGRRKILVESAQSVANRLEKVCLKGDGPDIAEELTGLPYVIVDLRDGAASGKMPLRTSSLIEAHRLNSPFIISNKEFATPFIQKAGYEKGKLLDWGKIAQAFFYYDPNCLIHGIFMANLEDGRVRLPRALTGFIEAEDIREAVSGGVKNNAFDPSGKVRAKDYDKDVYGNVPYHRTEYTARRITAFFNLDLALLVGYQLDEDATNLLIALSFYKIRRFLESGLRLRTACDLALIGQPSVIAPAGFALPSTQEMKAELQRLIPICRQKQFFADKPILLSTDVVKKEPPEKPDSGADGASPKSGRKAKN